MHTLLTTPRDRRASCDENPTANPRQPSRVSSTESTERDCSSAAGSCDDRAEASPRVAGCAPSGKQTGGNARERAIVLPDRRPDWRSPRTLTAQASIIDSSKGVLSRPDAASCTAALDATAQRSARKPGVGRKARGQTTGLTPAAQRRERIDAGRVAVAPRHSQRVAADEMSISDREPRRVTTGEPCLLATVVGHATCRARARPTQLFEVEPAHLAVIEGHLNVGVTVDGDGSDVDRRLSAHTQSLVLACSSSSPALAGHRQIPERRRRDPTRSRDARPKLAR